MPPEQIFLSYSRNDLNACIALRTQLEQAGFSVFKDDDSIRQGDRWVERLEQALAQCCAFVVLIGGDGVQRWVAAEVQVALIRNLSPHDDTQRLPIFPVLLDGTEPAALPPFLSIFQAQRWTSSAELPAGWCEAIRKRTTHFDWQLRIPDDVCPFLGLRAFSRADAKLFFGRRKETLEALAKLGDLSQTNPDRLEAGATSAYHRWLQIDGNSGAGKSSLVAAGMLPLIEQGWLWARTGFAQWKILKPMLPSDKPVTQLAECIEHSFIPDERRSERDIGMRAQRLRESAEALALYLRGQKQDKTAFLLVIDQFEELFTFSEEAERKQFDALIADALQDSACPLFLLSTVRGDFLDRYELLPRLGEIYNSRCNRHTLLTISQTGLREVIDGPAQLAGLDVSEVREAILRDARDETGALPLVENALHTLWQQRKGQPRLSGKLYSEQGGIVGMLSAQADNLLQRVDNELPRRSRTGKGRAAALELLFALTKVNEGGRHTRQRITRGEAIAVADSEAFGQGERVLNLLAGTRGGDTPSDAGAGTLRLVIAEGERTNGEEPTNGAKTGGQTPAEQYVDLIHETLLRTRQDEKTGAPVPYWPTLHAYVEKNRDRDTYRRQLREDARAWQQRVAPLRWVTGASWRELWSYRKHRANRVAKESIEARYLRASRWRATMVTGLLLGLLGTLGESTWWWRGENNEGQGKLPIGYIFIKPLWVIGYKPLPEMVTIPAGKFTMGCKPGRDEVEGASCDNERELQPKEVVFPKAFGMGKYEVTFLEYDYYVWSQRRNGSIKVQYKDDQGWGRYDRPVINVSWNDAQAYVAWLNQKPGKTYKLPSEAQWEYAARAGTKTAYWWGNTASKSDKANCDGCGSRWAGKQTAPVGSFDHNQWNLHDTAGNVLEWVEDDYRQDRGELEEFQKASRVLRGGSWYNNPQSARAALRRNDAPGNRNVNIGFRVCSVVPIE